jgi:hypothetical protein
MLVRRVRIRSLCGNAETIGNTPGMNERAITRSKLTKRNPSTLDTIVPPLGNSGWAIYVFRKWNYYD